MPAWNRVKYNIVRYHKMSVISNVVRSVVDFAIAMHEEKCSICYDQFDGTLTTLPCSHCFHRSCIEKWFYTSATCPLCRVSPCTKWGVKHGFPQFRRLYKIHRWHVENLAEGYSIAPQMKYALLSLPDLMNYDQYRLLVEMNEFMRCIQTDADEKETEYWWARLKHRMQ